MKFDVQQESKKKQIENFSISNQNQLHTDRIVFFSFFFFFSHISLAFADTFKLKFQIFNIDSHFAKK